MREQPSSPPSSDGMGPLCCLALQQGGSAVKLEGMVACFVSADIQLL